MKQLQQALICISVLALVFFGCKKEYSYEVPGGGGASGTYQWSFSEGANAYKGPVDTAFVDTLGTQKQLNISGHSSDNKDFISLQIFADTIKVGTYQTNNCSFDYLRNGAVIYRSDLTAIGQFTINITAMDSVSITGTFNGIALDSAQKQKTITDGKFKVKFKSKTSTTTPPQNCTISKLLYTDSTFNVNYFALFSQYNLNTISNIRLSDSTSPAQLVTLNYPVTFPAGKVNVPINGKPQYFTLDANGRATSFTGYQDPLTDTSNAMIASYTYDGSGHLIKRTEASPAAPGTVVIEMTYTWSGNLLTQAVVKYQGLKVLQVAYEYDNSKEVKNFLALHPYAAEIFYFQSVVKVGVIPDRALTKVTEQYFDASGTLTNTFVSFLEKYNIDANKNVQSFWVRGDDFTATTLISGINLYASTKYTLSYRCQ